MPDADELSFYRVSVMTIVTFSLAHYSPTHTSALACGIVAYRSRAGLLTYSFGITTLCEPWTPVGLFALRKPIASRSNWTDDFEREGNCWNFEYVAVPRNQSY
jgi:hypothetical protein